MSSIDRRRPDSPLRSVASEVEVVPHSMGVAENQHILYFKEKGGERVFSIWVSTPDGVSIAVGLWGPRRPRPMAADLLVDTITALEGGVGKVLIHDLRENTYYSRVYLVRAGHEPVVLDSRPSDALALAVRAGCPIYVEERLFPGPEPEKKPAGD